MVETTEKSAEAAWKVGNLPDHDRRLERAARRVDEESREHDVAALVIYETALMMSGRALAEVREMVHAFREKWEEDESELTIPHVSGIMNVEGKGWFFDDDELSATTGRLLGQFQHRVAQYNYVNEREVMRRWANSHDTRLFIRRRIVETEPVAGVIPGFDLRRIQYLRVAAGGNTLVPTDGVSKALSALGLEARDEYDVLARGEDLALHLDLPSPVVGEMLEDIARENLTDFPEPPRDLTAEEAEAEEAEQPAAEDREARETAREDPKKGEEPTRVQDPQAKQAPGVGEESEAESPASPETGKEDAPGNSEEDDANS